MCRKAAVIVCLCLSSVVVFAAPRDPGPMAPTGKVELADPVELPIEMDRQQAASLSPDGKRVLFVERNENRKSACCTVGVDGEDKAQVFESAVESDDVFAFCMGHGVWSPDGKQFAALTSEGGREDFRMVLYDAETGKTTPLPRERTSPSVRSSARTEPHTTSTAHTRRGTKFGTAS